MPVVSAYSVTGDPAHTCVLEAFASTGAGVINATVAVNARTQPLESFTLQVYVPADKPAAKEVVCGGVVFHA